MDARRGEVYGAVYDASLRLVCDEVVMPHADWIKTLPPGDLEVITQGDPQRSLARAIASIAQSQFAAGLAKDPAEIDANYVRRSDAELLWREPH
jgi:tRNA threonylcarbamoyladenosine biosynthesis protein TsaB